MSEHLIIAKPRRVHSLQCRGRHATMVAMAEDKDSPKKMWIGAEKYVQLGIAIPAATFIGWLLGGLLQRWFHYEWLPLAGSGRLTLTRLCKLLVLLRGVSTPAGTLPRRGPRIHQRHL